MTRAPQIPHRSRKVLEDLVPEAEWLVAVGAVFARARSVDNAANQYYAGANGDTAHVGTDRVDLNCAVGAANPSRMDLRAVNAGNTRQSR